MASGSSDSEGLHGCQIDPCVGVLAMLDIESGPVIRRHGNDVLIVVMVSLCGGRGGIGIPCAESWIYLHHEEKAAQLKTE